MGTFDDWSVARAALNDRARFPNIPSVLVRHLDECVKNGRLNRALQAVLAAPDRLVARVDRMFELAAGYTGLSADEIMRRTDFNYRDLDPNRVDSAFAEVRTINFFGEQRFEDITPIAAGPAKRADLSARRGRVGYAIEVATSIFQARGREEPEELRDWLLSRYYGDAKSSQLTNTASDLVDARRAFVGVVDSEDAVVFQVAPGFQRAVELAWHDSGSDATLHFVLVTGRTAVGYGPDDSFFPSWV